MEKLTLSDCFKYPNAKIKQLNFYTTGKVKLYDNTLEFIYANPYPQSPLIDMELSNCTLQLRRIEDLTEEEKKYIRINFLYEERTKNNFVHYPDVKDTTYYMQWNTFEAILKICRQDKIKEFADWCRENNFNIDFPEGDSRFEYIKAEAVK